AEDIQLLRHIRQCLYQEGYTIRGVQKLLGGEPAADRASEAPDIPEAPSLFPLERARSEAPPLVATKAPRRAPAQEAKPDMPEFRAALEDIRRELLEAGRLLAALTDRIEHYPMRRARCASCLQPYMIPRLTRDARSERSAAW